jgi:hypothetical protein
MAYSKAKLQSSVIPFLKFIYASVQISNVFVFIISFQLINFAFQMLPFLVPKSTGFMSYILQVISIDQGG